MGRLENNPGKFYSLTHGRTPAEGRNAAVGRMTGAVGKISPAKRKEGHTMWKRLKLGITG
jgi:hypothetical protein